MADQNFNPYKPGTLLFAAEDMARATRVMKRAMHTTAVARFIAFGREATPGPPLPPPRFHSVASEPPTWDEIREIESFEG